MLESARNIGFDAPDSGSVQYIAIKGRNYGLGWCFDEARCERSFVGYFTRDPTSMTRVNNDGLETQTVQVNCSTRIEYRKTNNIITFDSSELAKQ